MDKDKTTAMKLGAFLISFFVLSISVVVLRYLAIIPLILFGMIIGYLDLPPNPSGARSLEAIGNFFILGIGLYLATKTYKRIMLAEEKIEQNENEVSIEKTKEKNKKDWEQHG
jgi:hypothetical protein